MRTVLAVLWCVAAQGADTGLRVQVDAGFSGVYRVGSWVPVRVTVRNTRADVTGRLVVEATGAPGAGAAAASCPFHSPKSSLKSRWVCIYLADSAKRVRARLLDGQGEPVARGECALTGGEPERAELFGAVGPVALSLYPSRLAGEEAKWHVQVAIDPRWLPDVSAAYDPFSVLVFARPGADLDSSISKALAKWVRGGGRAVVIAGGRGPEFQRSFWSDLTGLSVGRSVAANLGPLLAREVRGKSEFDWPTQVAELAGRGQTVLRAGTHALAQRVRLGSGSVTVLAFDAAAMPFRDWPDAGVWWHRLLHTEPQGLNVQRAARVRRDTSEILASRIRHKESRELGLTWVVPLMLFYVILIGPVDYVLAKRYPRRRITWYTFPSYVLLFSAAIYWGARATKAGRMTYQHVTVLDAASGEDTGRVTKWFSIYPPESRVYSVACRQAGEAIGLAEQDVGVLAQRPETRYDAGGRATLAAALPQWSSQLLRADGTVPVAKFRATLLPQEDGVTLRIEGRLPVPLHEARVVYGRRILPADGLAGDETRRIGFMDRQADYNRNQYGATVTGDMVDRKLDNLPARLLATYLSLRRYSDRAVDRTYPPVFHARLDLTRHVDAGAAYIIGAASGDLPGEQVLVEGRPIAQERAGRSHLIVRYRLELVRE